MSTRFDIARGDGWELHGDIFEPDRVHLTLSGEDLDFVAHHRTLPVDVRVARDEWEAKVRAGTMTAEEARWRAADLAESQASVTMAITARTWAAIRAVDAVGVGETGWQRHGDEAEVAVEASRSPGTRELVAQSEEAEAAVVAAMANRGDPAAFTLAQDQMRAASADVANLRRQEESIRRAEGIENHQANGVLVLPPKTGAMIWRSAESTGQTSVPVQKFWNATAQVIRLGLDRTWTYEWAAITFPVEDAVWIG